MQFTDTAGNTTIVADYCPHCSLSTGGLHQAGCPCADKIEGTTMTKESLFCIHGQAGQECEFSITVGDSVYCGDPDRLEAAKDYCGQKAEECFGFHPRSQPRDP